MGSVPDWLSLAAGFLAVFAGVVAWSVSRELLKVEKKRDRE